MLGPKQNLGHISSAFLTFIWYKQTDRIIIQYFNFWNSQVANGKCIPPKKLANYRNSSNLSFFCADRSFAHCKLHFFPHFSNINSQFNPRETFCQNNYTNLWSLEIQGKMLLGFFINSRWNWYYRKSHKTMII